MLIKAYKDGDKQSFAELVSRYEKELYHFLFRFLGKSAYAEEAFQETFLQIYLSIEAFEENKSFRPWLYTIASNKARDLLRKRSRRPAVQLTALDDEIGTSELWDALMVEERTAYDILEQKETQNQVQEAIGKMPEHLREILLMAYFKQLSYKEISDVLDVPLGTVKSRLHAAVAAFAKLYRKGENIAG